MAACMTSRSETSTMTTTQGHEVSHHAWAAYKGPVVFTGPSGLRDHRAHLSDFSQAVGTGGTRPQGLTGDLAYITRRAPGAPFPLAKHGRSGEIGWPVDTFKVVKGL
ncbi:uncharacterized protein LOC143286506 [Babylonia areolata]|uniref:uncharacterized protein LOC143286506 n=1 Tax=Babylonia areolata TaxID=304850 RepID=UPI003FD1BC8D